LSQSETRIVGLQTQRSAHRRLTGVVLDAQGNLYGTTYEGGDAACDAPYGCGTVFQLDTTGKETVFHSFTPKPDGANLHAVLC
jgi:uncharacterized repeat protein (TIGR03803 family)